MAVWVDGIASTWDAVNTEIPASNIESIEVLKSVQYLAAYGARGGSGVLIVTTKRGGQEHIIGESVDDITTPGFINYIPKGYYKARQFYSPKYIGPKTDSQVADLRSTIYWQPLIETDKDGNAFVEYYNADGKGAYRVVIEGIDYRSGSIGRATYIYKVE